MIVIKKDNTEQEFDINKVIIAVSKSAERCMYEFTDEEKQMITNSVTAMATNYAVMHNNKIPIKEMHKYAEKALDTVREDVAKAYRDYRNYKVDFCDMLDSVYRKSQHIRYIGDVSNANTDSAMVSTQRSLIYGQLNKNLYQKFFLNKEELQAANDGYIYIHDMKDRLDGMNCFRRDTRFITINGIRSFYDFNDGDMIPVPTPFGNYKEAHVKCFGEQPIQCVTFRSLRGSDKPQVYCTPDHRWILKDESETTDLKPGDVLYEYDGVCWEVESIEDTGKIEEVWCLVVDDDKCFILEGGIPTGNCCLFDMGNVLKDGFEMGNQWYTEPKSLDVAFDVISDVTISAASQQYGGFTIPRVDSILAPYAEKSYQSYRKEFMSIINSFDVNDFLDKSEIEKKCDEWAEKKVYRDFEQGFQSWEYRFNTVGSSRGDYPFIACSFGIDTSRWGIMATLAACRVRKGGQGKPGYKKTVLFPKLNFLYDENLHGEGKPYEFMFDEAIECSKKSMYPDFVSLTGEGYIPSMYKKYGKVISLMGKHLLLIYKKLRELSYKQVYT